MKISKIAMRKNIKLQPVPPSMPPEALLITKTELIVPPMALTEAQVVILYIFLLCRLCNSGQGRRKPMKSGAAIVGKVIVFWALS